jgi:hypothetical protein
MLLAVSAACSRHESPSAPRGLPATLTLRADETRSLPAADLVVTFVEGPAQCGPYANCIPGSGQQGLFKVRGRDGEAGFLLAADADRLRSHVTNGVIVTLVSLQESRPRVATLRIERALAFD